MTKTPEPADAGSDEDPAATAAIAAATQRQDHKRIRRTLLTFSWHNYGLDAIEDADSREWATALATEIQAALNKR